MADAIEVLVAESLADSLSRTTFAGEAWTSVNAKMRYVPDDAAQDLGNLTVSVVPGDLEIGLYEGRGGDLHEPRVHVVIAKRIDSDDEIKKLVGLRTRIQDAIRSKTLTPSVPPMADGIKWWGMTVATTFDRDQLTASRVFVSDIEVTYRVLLGREDQG
jgi:hypothetical protein